MLPTDRFPWTYREKPASGGLVRPREQATPNHPTHKGRLYVVGYGWMWLSGWQQDNGSIRLAADLMTADQVETYCAPQDREARPVPPSHAHAHAQASSAQVHPGLRRPATPHPSLAPDYAPAGHDTRTPRDPPGTREGVHGAPPRNEGSVAVPSTDFDDDIPF